MNNNVEIILFPQVTSFFGFGFYGNRCSQHPLPRVVYSQKGPKLWQGMGSKCKQNGKSKNAFKWVYAYQDNSSSRYILAAELKNKITKVIILVFLYCHCLNQITPIYMHASHWCITLERKLAKIDTRNITIDHLVVSICVALHWFHTPHLSGDLRLH